MRQRERQIQCLIHPFQRLIEWSRAWFRPEEFFILLIEARHGEGDLSHPVVEIDADTVGRSRRRGRLSMHEAGILFHYLKEKSRVFGIVDAEGLLQAWSIVSRGRDFEKSGICVPAGELGYIHDTQVARPFRGRGRGESLNRAVARSLGADEKLLVLVRSSNRAALKAWYKCGANPILRIECRRPLFFHRNHRSPDQKRLVGDGL